jgi:hypothetical protein
VKGVTKFGSSKIAILMIIDGFAKDTFWIESHSISNVCLTTSCDDEALLVGKIYRKGIFKKSG